MTRYYISDGITDLDVLVTDDAELDGTFEALEIETGELFRVNGWQADVIEAIGDEL